MIKNKIKLLQLFCFLCAGEFATAVDEVITLVRDNRLPEDRRAVSRKLRETFTQIQQNKTYEEYLLYIRQTAEMEDFQAKMQVLKEYLPKAGLEPLDIKKLSEDIGKALEEQRQEPRDPIPHDEILADQARTHLSQCVRNICDVLNEEHNKMQAFVRTGPEVNCAIVGIKSKREGAIECFLKECTNERMINFVSKASERDMWIMWNDTFINAVRDNPELKARFEQIDAAIHENVESEHQKELWKAHTKFISDPTKSVFRIVG